MAADVHSPFQGMGFQGVGVLDSPKLPTAHMKKHCVEELHVTLESWTTVTKP
jgi:hypothetical protein